METLALFFAGALDAFANGRGRLFAPGAGNVAVFDGRDFDVEIDAVEERTGNALSVTVDLGRAATAFAFEIPEVAAGARVHRGDEHELGWEGDASRSAGDSDLSVFERMTVSPLTVCCHAATMADPWQRQSRRWGVRLPKMNESPTACRKRIALQ
jgi:hypothetical protein